MSEAALRRGPGRRSFAPVPESQEQTQEELAQVAVAGQHPPPHSSWLVTPKEEGHQLTKLSSTLQDTVLSAAAAGLQRSLAEVKAFF